MKINTFPPNLIITNACRLRQVEVGLSGILRSVKVSEPLFVFVCVSVYVFMLTISKFNGIKNSYLDANDGIHLFQNCSLNFTQATTYLLFSFRSSKSFKIQNIQNKTQVLPGHFSPSLIKTIRQLLGPPKYSVCIYSYSLLILPLAIA